MPYPIGDTIGIEFETEYIPSGFIHNIPDGWSTHNDASIERDGTWSIGGQIALSSDVSSLIPSKGNKITIGTEIVSIPFDLTTENPFNRIREICNAVSESGEKEESNRSGIHFHICMPSSLRVVKAALRLMSHMEDVFFQIAGNGYEFRGMSVAEASYCRPITLFGPQCVSTPRGYAQCFTVDDLLASTSMGQFWRRYGETLPNHPERYVPQRYSVLNFYSLNQHGTIEFRPFNKTFNPYFLTAELKLCQAFCFYVLKASFDTIKDEGFNTVNSVFHNRDKEDIARTLLHFAEVVEFDSSYLSTLLRIIEKTPPVRLVPHYVMTHVRNASGKTFWKDEEYLPTIIPERAISKVKLEDIHALRGEH